MVVGKQEPEVPAAPIEITPGSLADLLNQTRNSISSVTAFNGISAGKMIVGKEIPPPMIAPRDYTGSFASMRASLFDTNVGTLHEIQAGNFVINGSSPIEILPPELPPEQLVVEIEQPKQKKTAMGGRWLKTSSYMCDLTNDK